MQNTTKRPYMLDMTKHGQDNCKVQYLATHYQYFIVFTFSTLTMTANQVKNFSPS